MSTSGLYTSDYKNADLITEAFERAQVDPAGITHRHIESALRSIDFMFADWATKGVKQYKVERFSYSNLTSPAYTTGVSSLTLPGRILRLLTAVHRDSSNNDTAITLIGREDYEYINNKTQTGSNTDRIFLDRQRDAPVAYLWPVIDNANNSLVLTALVRAQDAGEFSDNPDIPYIWLEAFIQGLTARLAKKFNRAIYKEEKADADEAFFFARSEDRDQAPTTLEINLNKGRR